MTKRPSLTREFTGWHMLGVMVLFFGTIIAVNLTMAFFASSSWTGLVVKNSYVAGQTYNEELQKARAQAALGYRATLEADASALEFTLLDADGQPIVADRVEVRLGRPADDVDDHSVVLDYTGGGRYVAAALAPGQWQADVTATFADRDDWRQRWRLSVPRPATKTGSDAGNGSGG